MIMCDRLCRLKVWGIGASFLLCVWGSASVDWGSVCVCKNVFAVQSQDTSQAVQEERNRWQAEKLKLVTELEDYRRGVAVPGRGTVYHPPTSSSNVSSSPPDHFHKSPSPGSDDENLELSMIKVHIYLLSHTWLGSWVETVSLFCPS